MRFTMVIYSVAFRGALFDKRLKRTWGTKSG